MEFSDYALIGLLIVAYLGARYFHSKINKLEAELDSKLTNTTQLSFDFSEAVFSNPRILSLAGLTESQYKQSEWSTETQNKWENFVNSKDTRLTLSDLSSLKLTYLSYDDVFLGEYEDGSTWRSMAIRNRGRNNTLLFLLTLVYFPDKSAASIVNSRITLELVLRQEDEFTLITGGLKEKAENNVFSDSEYTKLFDFPLAKRGSALLNDEDYRRFEFTVERPPLVLPTKDDFGKEVLFELDTQIQYKHKSGATITNQY